MGRGRRSSVRARPSASLHLCLSSRQRKRGRAGGSCLRIRLAPGRLQHLGCTSQSLLNGYSPPVLPAVHEVSRTERGVRLSSAACRRPAGWSGCWSGRRAWSGRTWRRLGLDVLQLALAGGAVGQLRLVAGDVEVVVDGVEVLGGSESLSLMSLPGCWRRPRC